jgi:hypothetical protein
MGGLKTVTASLIISVMVNVNVVNKCGMVIATYFVLSKQVPCYNYVDNKNINV